MQKPLLAGLRKASLLVVLAAAQPSCGLDHPVVIVDLAEWAQAAPTLQISASLNQQSNKKFELMHGQPGFVFDVPAGASGELVFDAVGYDSTGCKAVYGQLKVQIGSESPTRATWTLPSGPRRCPLTVKVTSGTGKVTSLPEGLQCDDKTTTACTVDADATKPIQLTATPQNGMNSWYWSGACSGYGACSVNADTPKEARVEFIPGTCLNNFCWSNVVPQGNELSAVWGSGPKDVWMVGVGGAILHWNGDYFAQVASPDPTATDLKAIWGNSATDIWAGGGKTLLHWDGNKWSLRGDATVDSADTIWSSGPNDVWVGGQQQIWHYDGTTWNASPIMIMGSHAFINSIWGAGPQDIWAGGGDSDGQAGAFLSHWDGTAWSMWLIDPASAISSIRAIYGFSTDNIFAVGTSAIGTARDRILHLEGSTWKPDTASVSALGSKDIIALWGTSATDLWASSNGAIIHRTASGWYNTDQSSKIPANGIWGSGPGDVWAVGIPERFLRWQGMGWVKQSRYLLPKFTLKDFWESPTGELWAVSDNGVILRQSDGQWAPFESGTTDYLSSVWGSGPNDVWVGILDSDAPGFVSPRHWDGKSWTSPAVTSGGLVTDIWGSGPNDVWASELNANGFLHWQGAQWERVSANGAKSLISLWGSGPKDIWAGSYDGNVAHWDGNLWTTSMDIMKPYSLRGIWGSGPNDVRVAGGGGAGAAVLRWDGMTWREEILKSNNALFGIHGRSANDVWAVDFDGSVFHSGGSGWQSLSTGAKLELYAVIAAKSGDVWIGGYNVLLRYRAPN